MNGKINIMADTPDKSFNKAVFDISRELSTLNERMEHFGDRLDRQGAGIEQLNKRLFTGNGEVPMSTRLFTVEKAADRALDQTSRCEAPEMVKEVKHDMEVLKKDFGVHTDWGSFQSKTWYRAFTDLGKYAVVGLISTAVTLTVSAIQDEGRAEREEIRQEIEEIE